MSADYFIDMTLELIKNKQPEETKQEKINCIEKNWDKVIEYMRGLNDDARNGRS